MRKGKNVSFREFQDYRGEVPTVVIRILDRSKGNSEFGDLEFNDHWLYNKTTVHEFEFDDTNTGEGAITIEQGDSLFKILEREVQKDDCFILVHCVMGVCRSGAVIGAAQAIAQAYGFEFQCLKKVDRPNSRVKTIIVRNLYGAEYD